MASSSSNVVGVHYRVGKKIGEGSFGVIFEGTNLLNNQSVAIKFVCLLATLFARVLGHGGLLLIIHFWCRNRERVMLLNYEMNTEHTRSWLDAVRVLRLWIPSAC